MIEKMKRIIQGDDKYMDEQIRGIQDIFNQISPKILQNQMFFKDYSGWQAGEKEWFEDQLSCVLRGWEASCLMMKSLRNITLSDDHDFYTKGLIICGMEVKILIAHLENMDNKMGEIIERLDGDKIDRKVLSCPHQEVIEYAKKEFADKLKKK